MAITSKDDVLWQQAYEQGWRAGRSSGLTLSANPYKKGTTQHDGWRAGFRYHRPRRFRPY